MIARPPAPPYPQLDDWFAPSIDLEVWARLAFLDPDGPLYNEDHAHLADARICFLWTNVANARKGRTVVGTAELGTPNAMGKWAKAKAVLQLTQWFGEIPDFLITLSAGYWASVNDVTACALVEHELYHCAQELDSYGMPKFTRDGRPSYAIRGHDVEEFVGVVRRYGATSDALRDIAEHIADGPAMPAVNISNACGACSK